MTTSFRFRWFAAVLLQSLLLLSHQRSTGQGLPLEEADTICLVGNSMAVGIGESGYWETLLQTRWSEASLRVRCLGNPGSSMDFDTAPAGYETQKAALKEFRPSTIFAAFAPGEDAPPAAEVKPRLEQWLQNLSAPGSERDKPPLVILVSPTPCEIIGDGAASERPAQANALRQEYAEMMKEVAQANGAGVIDAFAQLSDRFSKSEEKELTSNGTELSETGHKALGAVIDLRSFGSHPHHDITLEQLRAVKAAVVEKTELFAQYRAHRARLLAAGDSGIQKMRGLEKLIENRDRRIWDLAQGKNVSGPIDDTNVESADALKQLLKETIETEVSGSSTRGFSIPLIDLNDDSSRQVIVDREPGQYLGHPTTVLLEDNSTMLCVYPKGHGRGAIVYKRSGDAGMTWSDRLPTPASWETSKEVPTLHRVVDAEGNKRLIMFSGLFPARMAVSEDDGVTWGELKPLGDWGGIVVMGNVTALKTPGHYMAMFHDDGRYFKEGGELEDPVVFRLFSTFSTDGGLTWSAPADIWRGSEIHLCEPGSIRSPDGNQIAVLLRENSRTRNSHVIFSNDEGNTWTEPRELPGALTGDRHTGKYGPDGRLFISFRDMAHESPTRGDWVGWVGTYQDIVSGAEGQYRVRLKDNFKASDCAYPGVEILPDGTFVTTTYGHWEEGKSPYIMSVRFTLDELDQRAAL